MLIGELARRAGVKAQTVRYYETLGLLSPVHRGASGYRSYGAQTLEELRFVRKAQGLGFSLDDVKTNSRDGAGRPSTVFTSLGDRRKASHRS